MNMLFLDEAEIGVPLPPSDERVRHVRKVLKKGPGDSIAAGTPDGRLGAATIEARDGGAMSFAFSPEREAPALRPVVLLLGFPRPIQANRILKDLSSLGISRILLSGTELGEKSYFQSDFFKNREFRSALIEGAMQAGNPRLPEVGTAWTLARALDSLEPPGIEAPPEMAGSPGRRWALDPYRAQATFGRALPLEAGDAAPLTLAIGSERGWTTAELDLLASRGFSFASLGDRILKTETAAVAAVSIALSRLGYL
ncbi:MAG: 16S rRNA (uracil(1498)-N(3))-methyltransferase [Spirochaetes bacterium]|nr:16S rRNA (uracil(1498)-N(3))-methyltransferase [Spirochaetota bacterium]MBU1080442.1 16S rRNA (uracil(1498)-N(3))-methyltransferase [Spirochaetota bacterium]